MTDQPAKTLEERVAEFERRYRQLVADTGLQFVCHPEAEALGPVIQIRAVLAVSPVADNKEK